MWVARDECGELYIYSTEVPYKEFMRTGKGYWATKAWRDSHSCSDMLSDFGIHLIPSELFPEIQWQDSEPTEVELVIKRRD